jgi:hypothetical protein
MTYALAEIPLEDLRSLRPEHDRSFQANIGRIDSWFSPLNRLPRAHERRLAFEIRQMLDPIQVSGPKLQISVQVFIL